MLTLPKSVISIGVWTFDDSKLQNIYVSTGNTMYSSIDGVLFDKNRTKLIRYPSGRQDSEYTIPNGVRTIGDHAFCNNFNVTRIILSDGVTTIDDNAFSNAQALNYIRIPKSVISMGNPSFYGALTGGTMMIACYAGTTGHLYARTNSIAYTLLDTAFTNPDFTLPMNTKNIDSEAFYGIAAKRVKLPEDIQAIRTRAFADCQNLVAIYIPEGCSTIAADAFSGVTNLTVFSVEGSYAEFYASRHGFDFVNVGSNP